MVFEKLLLSGAFAYKFANTHVFEDGPNWVLLRHWSMKNYVKLANNK
jgi:hypothetical protein